ncbi:MAG: DUF5522 domain-containing protein [Oligoflexales bacterium]
MANDSQKIVEGIDYYVDENGLFVFTREYHLKRGYCCHSGCRHCPYGESPTSDPPAATGNRNPGN